ncbi:DNA-processing protein DprA [Paenibacillaceae bacterium WGS1546]|uniref:DNA-processing protein DprA n=1 Tax=Cohnella sp. WGS1546 TaxID=3366810 RepID=UPI00372D141B
MTNGGERKSSENVRAVTKAEALETGMPRDVLIALHETEGVGRITVANVLLLGASRGPDSLRYAGSFREGDWRDLGLSAKQAGAVAANMRADSAERRRRRRERGGMAVVTYLDDDYPELLYEISDPPWVLYCRGRIELLRVPAIGIVGTRLATGYGRKVAEDLAAGCSSRMAVVSGLARGIDAAAHTGALEGACGTIAVVAGCVDQIYPPENKGLHREISERGLVVSESPPDTILRAGLFPLRNRIIAGMSRGVVVVEAARRSGALITADLALGYNRDVFVVPGQITSPRSLGALEYFRKGAHPALAAEDVFQMYKHVLPPESDPDATVRDASDPAAPEESLGDDELRIYLLLLESPRTIDELANFTGMTFGHLHSVLLSLLIKRKIQQQPGSVYHVL